MNNYLQKPYFKAILIGTLTSVVFYMLNYKNKTNDKNQIGFVDILKVFIASTISSLAILYVSNFKFKTKLQSGGGGEGTNAPNTQTIMTGKPSF